MKNANLKKRVLATMVSATVAFGGVAVAAPTADADVRVTSQYSQLDPTITQQTLQANQSLQAESRFQLLPTAFGPGWCIDVNIANPTMKTKYELRKLDGTSGYYGFNGDLGGSLKIHEDIERAAVSLTKKMLLEYNNGKGDPGLVVSMNRALQALLSNNIIELDKLRAEIYNNANFAGLFTQWTGFEIRNMGFKPSGQTQYYLVKSSRYAQQTSNVRDGEYVSVLVPVTYNVYQNKSFEPTNQRIVIIKQPGLKLTETVEKWVPGKVVTETVTAPRPTVTLTEKVYEDPQVKVDWTQPTVTVTQTVQPVQQTVEVQQPADVTATVTRRPSVVTSTATVTQPVPTETVTKTAEAVTFTETVTPAPEYQTVTETVKSTVTQQAPGQTATVTQTAEPVYVTEKVTAAPKTETVTVTAAPKTKVVETTVTSVNRSEVQKVVEVERYFRKYFYAFDFSSSNKEQIIEVDKLGDWQIDFVDDTNGLVDVQKVIIDGKAVLKITPKKKGRGTVRIVIVDTDGNRHEYSINVVNEDTKKIVTNEVVVNNHYFNVGIANLEQTIPVPSGWEVEPLDPSLKDVAKIVQENGVTKLVVEKNVSKARITVNVVEKVNGKLTGSKNVYTFNVDTTDTNRRVIGNGNGYKLEVKDVVKRPEVIEGADKIESIEQDAQGNWIILPKKDAEGTVVVRAEDKSGKLHTFTLDIKKGVNVAVDVETHTIFVGDSVQIKAPAGSTLENVAGTGGEWSIAKTGEGFEIKNNADGTAVYELRDQNGNVIGIYTIVARVKEEQNIEAIVAPARDVLDRNTIDLTPGNKDANTFKVTKGEEFVEGLTQEANGKYVLQPKLGADGTIEVTEFVKNSDGDDVAIATFTFNVTPGAVREVPLGEVSSNAQLELSAADLSKLRIVEGENLVESFVAGKIVFKPGAQGTVVVENTNSRDIPFERYTLNVVPAKPSEKTVSLKWNAEATLTIPEGYSYEVDNPNLVTVKQNGNVLVITPKDGATGTSTVTVKNERGVITEVYKLVVAEPDGSGEKSTRTEKFNLTVGGKFTVVRGNDNPLRIETGSEWVTIQEIDGRWILRPVGPEAAGKTVSVVETRGDTVVRRSNITIVGQPTELKFKEERRVVVDELSGKIVKGAPNNTLVQRGYDDVKLELLPSGDLQIIPIKGKFGTAIVEELDEQGNPVRIIEVATSDHVKDQLTEPIITYPTGNRKDGYTFEVKGGENSAEVNICTGENSCQIVTPKRTDDGKYLVEPGVGLDKADTMLVYPIENGIRSDQAITIKLHAAGNVNGEVQTEESGSSEVDPKCVAAIVTPLVPLMLAIPVGILSQVQIPGLEGVSAQINQAIREANDQIQRGLGIYDRDRAERAAGVQGAFQVANPEMLGLAAGTLGAITAGLLILDGILRACGQAESTSSYKIGHATDNETLMNASSTGTTKKDSKEVPKKDNQPSEAPAN